MYDSGKRAKVVKALKALRELLASAPEERIPWGVSVRHTVDIDNLDWRQYPDPEKARDEAYQQGSGPKTDHAAIIVDCCAATGWDEGS
jgi:hypothetical protein